MFGFGFSWKAKGLLMVMTTYEVTLRNCSAAMTFKINKKVTYLLKVKIF